MSDSVIEFLHSMKRHDLSTALTLERLELVRQLCDSQAEVERLRAVLRYTHTTYCTDDWTKRGRHAPECRLYEAEE